MKESLLKTIGSLLAIIGFLFAGYFYIDQTFAKSDSLVVVANRLDYKIESDIMSSQQDRLWKLEERYGRDGCKTQDDFIKKDIKDIQLQIERQKIKLRKYEK